MTTSAEVTTSDDRAPRLYIITDRRATGGRPLTAVIEEALEGARGSRHRVAVQLREKDLDTRSLLALARELRTITAAAGAWLFINDRIDVALASDADGVHLGGTSLTPSQVRDIAPHLRVAVSTHNRADVETAISQRADFVVFGPVYDTPSKSGHAIGVNALASVSALGIPVIALGGIEPRHTHTCIANGAFGIAAIRSVIGATNLPATVRLFLDCFAAF